MKFKIGITGNGEVPSVFYSKEGQELINKLCQGPVPKKEISSELLAWYVIGNLRWLAG